MHNKRDFFCFYFSIFPFSILVSSSYYLVIPSQIRVNEIIRLHKPSLFQKAEMMCMMQQLVVGGNRDSFGPISEGSTPQFENEIRSLPDPNQGQTTPPFVPQGVTRN